MTYYLKYRPQTLAELDSESVKNSLLKIFSSKNIPQAFLFSGPKGTGKTSAARIVAKIFNCLKIKKGGEPCNKCDQCQSIIRGSNLDILEIDAASHRGIDDVRALREAVKLSPARAKKKVYIIDEAHMLTLEASNALLKTLEEPPEHVVFILATTNPEKLIATIHSRVTEIVFKKAAEAEITRSLQRIVKGEKLKLKSEVLQLLASCADGSFRDAAKFLEQAVAERALSFDKVEALLEGKSKNVALDLLRLLEKRAIKKTLIGIENYAAAGLSLEKLIKELTSLAQTSLLAKAGLAEDWLLEIKKDELLALIDLLLRAAEQTRLALIEQLPLEIALIKWCEESGGEPRTEIEKEEKADEVIISGELPADKWQQVLQTVKPLNTSIEALLRAAKPVGFDGKTLVLGVYYRFHKERLEEEKYRRLLEEVVSKIMSTKAKVRCRLTEPPARAVPLKSSETVLTEEGNDDIVEAAKKIFGS